MSDPHYFLALPVPDKIRLFIDEWAQLLEDRVHFREWTHTADYHLTLVFLGATPDEQLNRLIKLLEKEAKLLPTIKMKLGQIGTFGSEVHPRVLWAGVESDDLLFQNQKKIADSCRQCDFEVEKRPYRPHITIAKKRKGNEAVSIKALAEHLPTDHNFDWTAETFVLYQVVPRATPKYKTIRTFTFEG